MKPGPKSGPDFGPFFWGPLVLAHFPQAPKTGSHFWARVWEAEYRHDLHFGARFWNHEIWTRIKKQCQMQSDNLYDYMWHPVIFAQLQPKRAGWFQLAACTHVRTGSCTLQQLWRPFVQGHIFYGFFRAR